MKRTAPENGAEGVYLGEPRSPFSANQYLALLVQAFKSRHDSPVLVKSFQIDGDDLQQNLKCINGSKLDSGTMCSNKGLFAMPRQIKIFRVIVETC